MAAGQQQQPNLALKDVLLDEACRVLNADRHTAARLLPLFETSSTPCGIGKSLSGSAGPAAGQTGATGGSAADEVKSSCGAALVSFLLLHLVLPQSQQPAGNGGGKEDDGSAAGTPQRRSDAAETCQSDGQSKSQVGTSGAGSEDDARDDLHDEGCIDNQMLGLATALGSFLSQQNADAPGSGSSLVTTQDVVHHCTQTLKSGTVLDLLLGKGDAGAGAGAGGGAGTAAEDTRDAQPPPPHDREIQRKLESVVEMLQQLELEVKATSVTFGEMDEVWSWACGRFLNEGVGGGGSGNVKKQEDMDGARETAWLLHSTLSVVSPDLEAEDAGEAAAFREMQHLHRRRLYLSACITILVDNLCRERQGQGHGEGDHGKPKAKKQKTTVEDEREAIAALSMMPTSAPSSPPSTHSGAASPDPESHSQPSTDLIRTQVAAKMGLPEENVLKAMQAADSWLKGRRHHFCDDRLGSPADLSTVRNLYHDLLVDNVSLSLSPDQPTLTWMGVVDEVMLYHEEQVRQCMVSSSNVIVPVGHRPPSNANASSNASKVVADRDRSEPAREDTRMDLSSDEKRSGDRTEKGSSPGAAALAEWLSRLCHDPALSKPSHPLTIHFDHSGGASLWHSITEILDRALQRLSDFVGEALVACEREGHIQVGVAPPAGAADAKLGGDAVRHQIQTAVLALYYYSLESIVSLETKRLHTRAHPQLLSNATFHRSLLAVSAQSVLRAMGLHNVSRAQFPSVLEVMEIDAYDFLKVSECFVRAVWAKDSDMDRDRTAVADQGLGLPVDLRKHLQECEELILDKLLWETANSTGGGIRAAIEAMRAQGCEAAWPPVALKEERENPDKARMDVDTSTLTRQQQQQHVTVSFVFRKLVTLSARRILELSEILSLDAFVTEQIWITWRQCLAAHVDLLYDRHVDQLILCTLYGVCKIARVTPEVSFAKIIESYYELNPGRERMNQDIIRNINLGDSKSQGNVIQLYNQVFVPSMKNHLLHFQNYANQQRARGNEPSRNMTPGGNSSSYATKCSLLPVRGALPTVSPHRVENSNLYVSTCPDPYHPEGGQGGPTAKYGTGRPAFGEPSSRRQLPPQTRSLYSFGEPAPNDVQMMNKAVNSGYAHGTFPQHASISDDDMDHERQNYMHRFPHQQNIPPRGPPMKPQDGRPAYPPPPGYSAPVSGRR